MGYDIDFHYGNYEEIVKMFVKAGCKDEKIVRKAMDLLGIHVGEQYFILYNDCFSEMNPATNLTNFLDEYFKLNDDGKIFSKLLDMTEEKNMYFDGFEDIKEKLKL